MQGNAKMQSCSNFQSQLVTTKIKQEFSYIQLYELVLAVEGGKCRYNFVLLWGIVRSHISCLSRNLHLFSCMGVITRCVRLSVGLRSFSAKNTLGMPDRL